jgi:hypothetical protein
VLTSRAVDSDTYTSRCACPLLFSSATTSIAGTLSTVDVVELERDVSQLVDASARLVYHDARLTCLCQRLGRLTTKWRAFDTDKFA